MIHFALVTAKAMIILNCFGMYTDDLVVLLLRVLSLFIAVQVSIAVIVIYWLLVTTQSRIIRFIAAVLQSSY